MGKRERKKMERQARKVCFDLKLDPDKDVGFKQKTGAWLWAPRWVFYSTGGYGQWAREQESVHG